MKRLAVEIADALSLAARERDDIWVLDGDLGDSYGLYDDHQQPRFARFLQVGIAEQTLVGAAAGLAAAGKLPWVFSFSSFLCHRAADQIRTCVAQPALPVVLVGSHAGAATGVNGCSHASLGDLGVLSAIGGIELWAPADIIDVAAAVTSLLESPRPAYLRTSREPVRALPLDQGTIRTNGIIGKVALLSTGFASQWASEVVAILSRRGIAVPWGHVAQLEAAVLRRWIGLHPTMRCAVVLEDHSMVGGLADALRRVAPPAVEVLSLGWPERWHGESGSIDLLRSAHGLDTATVTRCIENLL
jgi:transketolase